MRQYLIILTTFLWGLSLHAQKTPKLVVGIVVDQMRADYLYRFENDFGAKGFNRLRSEGMFFRNMHYNYIPTYTAPGHASIYTGTTPSVHGIVGNDWFHKHEQKRVYCTSDAKCETVGDQSDEDAGRMSPHRMESTTITDELKLKNPNSKVFGISIKDRGAILPAGHFADQAFWMNSNGNFISSNFYNKPLPKWVEKYNKQDNTQKYLKKGWDLVREKGTYTESISDDNPYERILKPKKTPTFPYNLEEIAKEYGREIIKTTPYGNNMVAELGTLAIQNEQLGKDEVTDFLALSFSSTDYVGHSFGPRSVEIQDTYIRLDETLAELFTFLDKEVGKGEYVVFLTADHAAADNADFLRDRGYQVDDLRSKEISQSLAEFTQQKFGVNLISDYFNQNVFLDDDLIFEKKLDRKTVEKEIMAFAMNMDYVKHVYTRAEITQGNENDLQLGLIANGFDRKQNGDLFILFKPGFMESYTTGTTHGTGYSYDTHVPLLFMGKGIKQGTSVKKHAITSIAPTLSILLEVGFPNGSPAIVLEEVLE